MRQTIEASWTDWDGKGLERLILREGDDSIVAEGEIKTSLEDSPFHARYRISCNKQWQTRTVEVTAGSRRLVLACDGAGTVRGSANLDCTGGLMRGPPCRKHWRLR